MNKFATVTHDPTKNMSSIVPNVEDIQELTGGEVNVNKMYGSPSGCHWNGNTYCLCNLQADNGGPSQFYVLYKVKNLGKASLVAFPLSDVQGDVTLCILDQKLAIVYANQSNQLTYSILSSAYLPKTVVTRKSITMSGSAAFAYLGDGIDSFGAFQDGTGKMYSWLSGQIMSPQTAPAEPVSSQQTGMTASPAAAKGQYVGFFYSGANQTGNLNCVYNREVIPGPTAVMSNTPSAVFVDGAFQVFYQGFGADGSICRSKFDPSASPQWVENQVITTQELSNSPSVVLVGSDLLYLFVQGYGANGVLNIWVTSPKFG